MTDHDSSLDSAALSKQIGQHTTCIVSVDVGDAHSFAVKAQALLFARCYQVCSERTLAILTPFWDGATARQSGVSA